MARNTPAGSRRPRRQPRPGRDRLVHDARGARPSVRCLERRSAAVRMLNALRSYVRGVDAINDWIGRTAAWLTLGCVLTCFAVVVLRYAVGVGFPWLQEFYVWQHAAVFIADQLPDAASGTRQRGRAVRTAGYPRQGVGRHRRHAGPSVPPWLSGRGNHRSPFVSSSWSVRGLQHCERPARGLPAQVAGLGLLRAAVRAGTHAEQASAAQILAGHGDEDR